MAKNLSKTPKAIAERAHLGIKDENEKFNRKEKKKGEEDTKAQEKLKKKIEKEEKKEKKMEEKKIKQEIKEKKKQEKRESKEPSTPSIGGDKVKKSFQKVKNKLHMRSTGFNSKVKESQEKDAMLFQVLNSEKEGNTSNIETEQKEEEEAEVEEEIEDSFLNTLIDADEIEPAVKGVFEAEKETECVVTLDKFIIKKENEIEQICNWNYQEFITSVDELLEVREETTRLKDSLTTLNRDVQRSGKDLLSKHKQLLQYKKMRHNITLAMELIKDSQYLLELVASVNSHLKEREFYAALKVLDQIEKVLLPDMPRYSFVQYIESTIPNLKYKIKKGATEDLNQWLLLLRENNEKIGKFAVDLSALQLETETKLHITNRETAELIEASESGVLSHVKKGILFHLVTSADSNESIRSDESVLSNRRYKIDFTPLYQVSQVYKSLGIYDQFQKYYRENRRLQAKNILNPTNEDIANMHKGKLYQKHFHNIAGFFIIEHTVSQTSDRLMPESVIEKLWSTAISKMRAVIQEQLSYTLLPEDVTDLKNFVLIFSQTLKLYEYDVSQLENVTELMRDTFGELMMNFYNKKFVQTLDAEKWEALVISDVKDFEQLVVQNKLQKNSSRILPQTFVFSRIVPTYCQLIKDFVADFYKFAPKHLNLDEYIKKSTEKLLSLFNITYMQVLEQSQSIDQLTRSCLNLVTLIEISPTWDEYLTKLSYNGIKVKLVTRFEEMMKHTEQFLVDCLKKKIRAIIKDTKLIWNQSSSSETPTKYDPREYATQLVTFLDQSFGTFASLSVELQENLQTNTFIEVNNILVELIHSDSVKHFSGDGMRQLDADLTLIENFADRTIRVKNPKDLLGEIRQLINLFVSEQTNELLDSNFRSTNYSKLTDPAKLIPILEKYKEESRFFKKPNKEKVKAIDSLVHQLRSLTKK